MSMEDFKELGVILGAVLIAVLVLCALLICGILWPLEAKSCHAQWEGSGFGARYGFFSGCQIQVHGSWLPDNAWKQIQMEISK